MTSQGVQVKFVLPRKMVLVDDWMEFHFADRCKMDMRIVRSLLSPYLTPTEYLRNRMLAGQRGFSTDLMGEVLRYARLAGKVADEVSHELIHVHDWMTYLAGIEARKRSSKPLVMHVHSTEYDRSGGSLNPSVHEVEQHSFPKADQVIAVSQYTKNILTRKYGVKASMIDVVHNGVHQPGEADYHDMNHNQMLELKNMGYKIVLYTGRFTMHKGLDYLLKAMKIVIKYHPKAVLVLVGSGEKEYELIEMAANLGLSNHVVFAGWMRGQQLAQMYHSADVYVQPSVSEPFGISPLEALTYNTPVIVSKQSGVSEGLRNALKVDFWDVDDLAEKIIAALGYDSLHHTLQEEGYHEVQKFSWGAAAQKCLEVYNKVLA
jgi:glycosyltransferase involved in cell wall biosynthesis